MCILRILNFRLKIILKQSQSAEKGKKGDSLGFLKLQFVAKYRLKVVPFGDRNKFRKESRTVWNKIQREYPTVSSGFVSYVKNGINEMRNTLQ